MQKPSDTPAARGDIEAIISTLIDTLQAMNQHLAAQTKMLDHVAVMAANIELALNEQARAIQSLQFCPPTASKAH